MNPLKQYIDLFEANRASMPAAFAPLQSAALASLEGVSLPRIGSEGYEMTDLGAMYGPDYGVNLLSADIPVDVARSFKCAVPAISAEMGFMLNDTFVAGRNIPERLPSGVSFTSLSRAAAGHPDLVGRYLGRIAPLDNPAVALNTLLMHDGVFIHVPRGVRIGKPMQLVNIFSAPIALMGVRRVVIALEEDAEASLLVCDHTQDEEQTYMASQVTEIHLARGARLNLCALEESSARTARHAMTFVRQDEGSSLSLTSVTLTCGTTRNEFSVSLEGENAFTRLSGMAIGSGRMHIDNESSVTHRAGRCKSDQVFKYVLDDESVGAFEGSILVAPGARFTEAYQSDRNLLASPTAKMHTKPQLEIYNDDVKCSHGAATGQLDSDALFYMQSRGIPLSEARTMLMQAFLLDVVDTVDIPGVAERLRHLVERRFTDGASCEGCAEKL